jgi:hypothetical protein
MHTALHSSGRSPGSIRDMVFALCTPHSPFFLELLRVLNDGRVIFGNQQMKFFGSQARLDDASEAVRQPCGENVQCGFYRLAVVHLGPRLKRPVFESGWVGVVEFLYLLREIVIGLARRTILVVVGKISS